MEDVIITKYTNICIWDTIIDTSIKIYLSSNKSKIIYILILMIYSYITLTSQDYIDNTYIHIHTLTLYTKVILL